MKFTLVRNDNGIGGSVDVYIADGDRDKTFPGFIGHVEIPIDKPKELVRKEIAVIFYVRGHRECTLYDPIPEGAKNPRVIFDIEE